MKLVALAASAALIASHPHHPYHAQNPGCRTHSCDVRVWRAWARAHPARRLDPSGPMSALEACIIRHESGGDPHAVSGKYSGIGQWEQSRWESDHGTRFASTPLGATYAEQEAVLRSEGEAGMIDQQGQYDGCA